MAGYLIRVSNVIQPIDLVDGDVQCFAVIARYNEFEQWSTLNSNTRDIKEFKIIVSRLNKTIANLSN